MQDLQAIEADLRSTAGHRPLSIKAVIVTSDQKILLLRRPQEDRWDMPGGGVDEDETIVSALVRELREETDITVDNAKPLYTFMRATKNKPEKLIQYVLCHLDQKSSEIDIKLSSEHIGFRFFDHHEIQTLKLMPSYMEALRCAREEVYNSLHN